MRSCAASSTTGGLHDLDNPQAPNWTTADALASIGWLLGTTIPAPSS